MNAREKGEIKIGKEAVGQKESRKRVSLTNASRGRGRRAIIIHLSNDGSVPRNIGLHDFPLSGCLFQISSFVGTVPRYIRKYLCDTQRDGV